MPIRAIEYHLACEKVATGALKYRYSIKLQIPILLIKYRKQLQ